jgi:hypothetical protein
MIVTSPLGNNNVTGAWRVIVTMAIASFHPKVADLRVPPSLLQQLPAFAAAAVPPIQR